MRDTRQFKERRRALRRLDQSGATAVEFAMVAGPLLFMIFSILELATVFVVSTSLDNAMSMAARRIRTGEFQTATKGMSAEALKTTFRTSVCANMSFMEDHCLTNLSVNVAVIPNFGSGPPPSPVQPDRSYDDTGLSMTPGQEGQRVLASAFYKWPLVTPFLGEAMEKTDGHAVLFSAVAFQNEPFGDGS